MSSRNLIKTFIVMNEGNIIYKNYMFVEDDTNIDFYVILNYPTTEVYLANKSIVLQMEPWVYDDTKPWGVKTWEEWAIPDCHKFLHVRRHIRYLNPAQWFFHAPKTMNIAKKDRIIAFLSNKTNDSGHVNRIEFIRYIEKNNLDIIDIYGRQNYHNLTSYKGTAPSSDIITDYKYLLSAENNNEYNYATEKIWEAFISYTLCFYDGCPNLTNYVPKESYIPINLAEQSNTLKTIINMMKNNEWEKRLPFIETARKLTIEKYNALEVIHEVINGIA